MSARRCCRAAQRLDQERPGVPPVQPARAAPCAGGVEARVSGTEPEKNGGDVGQDRGWGPSQSNWRVANTATATHHQPLPTSHTALATPPAPPMGASAGSKPSAAKTPRCAAVCDRRCAPHGGRRMLSTRMSHSRKASNSSLMMRGNSTSLCAMNVAACCCASRYRVVCSGLRRSWFGIQFCSEVLDPQSPPTVPSRQAWAPGITP